MSTYTVKFVVIDIDNYRRFTRMKTKHRIICIAPFSLTFILALIWSTLQNKIDLKDDIIFVIVVSTLALSTLPAFAIALKLVDTTMRKEVDFLNRFVVKSLTFELKTLHISTLDDLCDLCSYANRVCYVCNEYKIFTQNAKIKIELMKNTTYIIKIV